MSPEARRVVVAWGGGRTLAKQVGRENWSQTFPRHFLLLFCQLPGKAVLRRAWRNWVICDGQWAREGEAAGQELNPARPEGADRGRGGCQGVTVGTRGRCGEQVALEGLQGQRYKGRHRQNPHISGSTSWADSQRDNVTLIFKSGGFFYIDLLKVQKFS